MRINAINTLLAILTILMQVACTEIKNPAGIAEEALATGTKGQDTKQYYWYRGEKQEIVVNYEFVNILLSKSIFENPTAIKALCQKYNLIIEDKSLEKGLIKVRFSDAPQTIDTYSNLVSSMREDNQIQKVLPYFDRGSKTQPIGTSQFFYIKLRQGGALDDLIEIAKDYDVMTVEEVPYTPRWYKISIVDSHFATTIEASNTFFETGLFEETDPAFLGLFQPHSTNDPLFSQQWGLKNTITGYDINVEGAWDISTGTGVKIAIIDQAISPNQNDLSPNFTTECYDAEYHVDYCVWFDEPHGTNVAGVAAAVGNNNYQIAGVAYNAKLMRISDNFGTFGSVGADLGIGINWAWANGADVINNCWGEVAGETNLYSSVLENAISDALTYGRSGKGSVIVFSAGNDTTDVAYPANYDERILVAGAITTSGTRLYCSNYGATLDVVAPGENIVTTDPNNSVYPYFSGTSAAAPHVSGVAALMIAANPNLTQENVGRIIETTATKISPNGLYSYYSYPYRYNGTRNSEMGYGLINATAAVTVARDLDLSLPSGNQGMDTYLPTGYAALMGDTLVMGSFPSTTGFFALANSWCNSSYTYYWFFRTTGDSNWKPTFNYVGNDTGVELDIPKPSSNSTLKMYCRIYTGSTYVNTASYTLYVQPDF